MTEKNDEKAVRLCPECGYPIGFEEITYSCWNCNLELHSLVEARKENVEPLLIYFCDNPELKPHLEKIKKIFDDRIAHLKKSIEVKPQPEDNESPGV